MYYSNYYFNNAGYNYCGTSCDAMENTMARVAVMAACAFLFALVLNLVVVNVAVVSVIILVCIISVIIIRNNNRIFSGQMI